MPWSDEILPVKMSVVQISVASRFHLPDSVTSSWVSETKIMQSHA